MKYYRDIIHPYMLLGLVGLAAMACKVTPKDTDARAQTGKETGSTTAEMDSTHNREQDPQIIFLTYSIKKDPGQGGYSIELIDEIITEGKIKMRADELSSPKAGDLRCVALDGNQQPVSQLIIPDPLNKVVEYVSEDGTLAKKGIALDSAQFSVRMQLSPPTKFIAVERIDSPDRQGTQLILTQINAP